MTTHGAPVVTSSLGSQVLQPYTGPAPKVAQPSNTSETRPGSPGAALTSIQPTGFQAAPPLVAERLLPSTPSDGRKRDRSPSASSTSGRPPVKRTKGADHNNETETGNTLDPGTNAPPFTPSKPHSDASIGPASTNTPPPPPLPPAAAAAASIPPLAATTDQGGTHGSVAPIIPFLCLTNVLFHHGNQLVFLLQLNLDRIEFSLQDKHYLAGPVGTAKLRIFIRKGWVSYPTGNRMSVLPSVYYFGADPGVATSFGLQASDIREKLKNVSSVATVKMPRCGFVAIVCQFCEFHWEGQGQAG